MTRFFTRALLALSLLTSTANSVDAASKDFTCRQGTQKVERAGVILVKKYGHNPLDFAIMVGEDHSRAHWNVPGGGVDHRLDRDNQGRRLTTYTAARETMEETGGMISIHPGNLMKRPYIYAPRQKIQLYVFRDDHISTRMLTAACQTAQVNPLLPRSHKEVLQYRAIPVRELLTALDRLAAAGYPSSKQAPHLYVVRSRNGHPTKLQGNYMRAMASQRHQLRAMLNQTCGIQF